MLEHASQSWQDCEAIKFLCASLFLRTSDLRAVQPYGLLCGGTSQGFQQAGMHGTVTGNHIASFQRFIA